MKSCLARRVLAWGALGLVVPILLLLRWKLFSSSFGQLEATLWPSAILLMGLDGPSPRSTLDTVEILALVIGENVILYSLVGLVTSPIVYLVLRKRNRPS